MVFSLILIVLLGIVAFFHYVQGFFSATISAIIVVLAAVLAVSYDETVVNLVFKKNLPDHSHAMVLCMIFAVVYLVLRIIFDMAIPGNVRVPATLDKVGSAIMGIIAGIFITGTFAIAVQMLPFDPGISIMGYGRYALHDNPLNPNVVLPTLSGQQKDTSIYSEMDDPSMEPDKEKSLLLPVDDWVLDAVYHLSDGGSLAGDRSLTSVHPDYLQELFGERLGIQVGARRSALYTPGSGSVDVTSIFTSAKPLPASDGQVTAIRPKGYKVPTQIKAGTGQTILVVRVKVASGATDDTDQIFRFSCGSVRLVGPTAQGTFKDYYPVGMLESGVMVLANKPDDFLFVQSDHSFDAVFVVDSGFVASSGTSKKIAPGVFLTVKRNANLDLSGQTVKETIVPDPNVQLIRSKVVVVPPPPPAVASAQPVNPAAVTPTPENNTPNSTPAPTPVSATPQPTPGKEISDTLTVTPGNDFLAPGSIAVGTTSADPDAQNASVAGGTMNLKGGMIQSAKVDPTASLTQLGQGVQGGSQFYVPAERAMVQAVIHPYENNWDWISQIATTALIDANGNSYPLSGFYAVAKNADSRGLLLRYDASHAMAAVSPPDGPPQSDVYLIFLIPHETDIKTLKVGPKQQNLDAPLHVQ